jgi:heat-inducible transcriptional repressor
MMTLDGRKVRILQTVVEDYVHTTRPVGSERLMELCDLGCKPATIRNEMAEMADMGYLAQPHTSAGRIPTDLGYRYYVDELMDSRVSLKPEEVQQIRLPQGEVEELLQQTCRILAHLTHYASIATHPVTESVRLRRVYLAEADARHLLLVVLLSTGHVEHLLLETEVIPSSIDLLALSGYLHSITAGYTLEETLRGIPLGTVPQEFVGYRRLLQQVLQTLAQMAASLSNRRVYLEGTGQLLRQPEFHDIQRLETLLNALEQHQALLQVLSRVSAQGRSYSVVIGSENEWEPLQVCAIVTTTYEVAGQPVGYLGVVGPTRMEYWRATAAVQIMAQNLSNILTNLSLDS